MVGNAVGIKTVSRATRKMLRVNAAKHSNVDMASLESGGEAATVVKCDGGSVLLSY
jgi:hypothetical protein